MRPTDLRRVAACALLCACAGKEPSFATGDWTGNVTVPGSATPIAIVLSNDSVPTIRSALGTDLPKARISDLRVGDAVRFRWSPDVTRSCTLAEEQNGTYVGTCTAAGQEAWTLRLVPPTQK